jgi:hypothetical protein
VPKSNIELIRRLADGFSELDFKRFRDALVMADTVLYALEIEARGRGSGAEVKDRITQAWTIHDGKVTRLGMYARRRTALAVLGHG